MFQPSTAGYYDPSSQFGTASSISTTRTDANSFTDTSKFGVTGSGVTDSTSSPVPSTVAATGQPTPFNALGTFLYLSDMIDKYVGVHFF